MAHRDLVLGIDGGGTKTIAWLARRTGAREEGVLGRGQSGPANQRSVGQEAAVANLDQAVARAFQAAGLDRSKVSVLCAGVAGSNRPQDRRIVQEWGKSRGVADVIQVVHDALPVLYAGSSNGCGIAVIAGTGSSALGRDENGRMAHSGGWGHLFGDEGSAYAIAEAGLRAAARAADGRGAPTVILDMLLSRLRLEKASRLVNAIYREESTPANIAELADVVFAAADQEDLVAERILQAAAAELASLVRALCQQLELVATRLPLAMGGGVLVRRPDYRHRVLATLVEGGIVCNHVSVVAEPVVGAVQLARQANA